MSLRKLILLACAIPSLIFIYAISNNEAAEKYVANVNNVKIKGVSLDAAVSNFVENQKMMGMDIKEGELGQLRKDILEELISAELLYQESQKAGLGNLDKEINQQFENIKKAFGSEEEFEKVLKERGIAVKDLKDDIKKGTYIKRFLEKNIYMGINVTDEDKKAEYEKNKARLDVPEHVRASHILIKAAPDAGEGDKALARSKIEDIRKRLLAGEDFAELAKENSEDGSAVNGGDLGYFRRGDMVKPFEDTAFSLENGKISDVIETQFGYHILKVTDNKPAHTLTYDEVEKDIGKFLLGKRQKEAVNNFVGDLRKKAKIERYAD